jgi:hypothetical protein
MAVIGHLILHIGLKVSFAAIWCKNRLSSSKRRLNVRSGQRKFRPQKAL